jgi:hypothetical protein
LGTKHHGLPAVASARFRIMLPIAYGIVSQFLFLVCLLNAYHSVWCQYFLDSMFPSGPLGRALLHFLSRSGTVQQSSSMWGLLDTILQVPLPFLFTVAQYYLIGLLIDRFISRRAS